MTHFERLAQAMIDEFDGLPFAGGTVNGTLTVSENIADAGGLSCALEAAQKKAMFLYQTSSPIGQRSGVQKPKNNTNSSY